MDIRLTDIAGVLTFAAERDKLKYEHNRLLLAKVLSAQYHKQSIMISDEELIEDIEGVLEQSEDSESEDLLFMIVNQEMYFGNGKIEGKNDVKRQKIGDALNKIFEVHPDLTMSMERAMEILVEKTKDIELEELLFVLVCFRDNAKHDDVYEFLDKIIKGYHDNKK